MRGRVERTSPGYPCRRQRTSGTAKDSEDTLRFAALTGVRPMIEEMPLGEANRAYAKMMEGEARFRMVLSL